MKVTIDSTEPLQDALRVLGAMYDVTVVASTGSADAQSSRSSASASVKPRAHATASRSTAKRKSSTAPRKRSAKGKGGSVSNTELRAWAAENGYTVADRGRLPAQVVEAYNAAQPS